MTAPTSWYGIATNARQVLTYAGFVELSFHAELSKPASVGLMMDDAGQITWFHGATVREALEDAARALELSGKTALQAREEAGR